MRKIRNIDGRVHFSDLKKFALSPAHYKHACESTYEATRDMRIGTCAHQMVLGPRQGKSIVMFDGDRRQGSKWIDFAEENRGREIVTGPEWKDALTVAAVISQHPVIAPFLIGRKEVPLQWVDAGIECATDGVDVVGDGWIADLKLTNSAEPRKFERTAASMFYHCQMAFYETGAKANGIDTSKGMFLLACESRPPYACTVFELNEATIAQGRKSNVLWLERLRQCEENDFWPEFAQAPVPLELPAWMGDGDEELELEVSA